MSYDLFISYSRRDNEQDRVAQLVDRVSADFAGFAGRPLVPFFDITEIRGMDDWRHRILQGLRESHLLVACLSPAYLQSEYCEWEFNEYLKQELASPYFGEGVAPIYFVAVPGWESKGFERNCAAWVAELRRRHYVDLRPWYHSGEESLRDATVRERMRQLNVQLTARVARGERAAHSLGNVGTHNPHFVGRATDLRRLRETVALGKVGVLTVIHGLGGVGKTALAVEYAHAFAHEYGGGRWQIRCEGEDNLCRGLAQLAGPLDIRFADDERNDLNKQFGRVLEELRVRATRGEPQRCLLILDNVDQPRLLEPVQTQHLPSAEWLHVIVTTRLGAAELSGSLQDRAFLPVDELAEADALDLVESYQPNGCFASDTESEAGRAIVRLLGCFTLAVEAAAVYLGQFADDVTCVGFLARLQHEGLAGLERAGEGGQGVRHGEKDLRATLQPTLQRLSESERLTLSYATLIPADQVVLKWIRRLVAIEFPEVAQDAEPGYPDPWKSLLRRLLSLRLLQPSVDHDENGALDITRLHRLVQEVVELSEPDSQVLERERALFALLADEAPRGTVAGAWYDKRSTFDKSAAFSVWLELASLKAVGEVALQCDSAVRRALLHRAARLIAKQHTHEQQPLPVRTPADWFRDWLRAWCDAQSSRHALLSRFSHMEYDLDNPEERQQLVSEQADLREANADAVATLQRFEASEGALGTLHAFREILFRLVGGADAELFVSSLLREIATMMGDAAAADGARAIEMQPQRSPLETLSDWLRARRDAETGSLDSLTRFAQMEYDLRDANTRQQLSDDRRQLQAAIEATTSVLRRCEEAESEFSRSSSQETAGGHWERLGMVYSLLASVEAEMANDAAAIAATAKARQWWGGALERSFNATAGWG